MRILVVGAVEGGSLSVGRAMYTAFREIGQEAEFLDYSDYLDDFVKVVETKDNDLSDQFLLKCNIRLMQRVLDFRPDAILGIAQSPMVNPEILIKLRKAGIILCFWFVEDYRIFEYWKSYAPFFNHYFTIQKDPFWEKLKEMGCHNFYYLPAAFDDSYRNGNTVPQPEINVSFVGAPYPNRVHFFSQLKRRDFQIYGHRWEEHNTGPVVIGDRWVSDNEAKSIYQRSLVNINLHSSSCPESFGDGDFVNPRTFELAGMGVFQLTDMRQLLPLHFDLKEELVTLNSWEDMKRAIDYFLEHETERSAFAKRVQARVLRDYTYKKRAEEIVNILS
ncbi:MAG: glycosyltransferase [Deltaproteobacteria bacterium]|nr:glycosyltransferase [Deltaproteobacteria bacterium]